MWILAFVVMFVVNVVLMATTPFGYQDENGFHLGEPKRK